MSINAKFQSAWAMSKALPRKTKRFISKHRYDIAGYSISVLFYLFVFFFYFCVSFAVTSLVIQAGGAVILAVILGALAAIMMGIPVVNIISSVHNAILMKLAAYAVEFEDTSGFFEPTVVHPGFIPA